jgi:hypothetical protein
MTQGNEPSGEGMPVLDRSKISVIHCYALTGHVIDPAEIDRDLYPPPARQPFPTFATAEEAKDYCREIVRRLPHLECHVTGPGLAPWRTLDEVWIKRESQARRTAFARQRRRDVLIASAVGAGLLVFGAALLVVGSFLWLWLR